MGLRNIGFSRAVSLLAFITGLLPPGNVKPQRIAARVPFGETTGATFVGKTSPAATFPYLPTPSAIARISGSSVSI
jgi:hypothetical protein